MIALGVHEDTNANAAAVDSDGRILGAVAEGRLNRIKYQGGYPKAAIEWLADSGALRGIQPGPGAAGVETFADALRNDDLILSAANPYHPIPRVLGAGPPGDRDFLSGIQTAHVAWHALIHRSSRLRRRLEAFCQERLEARWGRGSDLLGHHAAHAASAYYTGPWPEATIVTCDNLGDGECATAFHGKDGRLSPLWSVGAWHSPGQFYGEIASFLGIDPMNAGKVTGLAARGQPEEAAKILRQRLHIAPDRRGFRGPPASERRRNAPHWQALSAFSREDVAAAAQQVLEEALIPFVREAVRTTGCSNVALAGGVFANVALNRLLGEMPEVSSLWVHPAMSDQGIALGAAYLSLARRGGLMPRAMEHVFLGPSWTPEQCSHAIDRAGAKAARPDDLAGAAADLLAEGKVVCRFDGGTEYGPRALGNRSILVRPDDKSVNDWLNERLDRSEYMPFAPMSLASHGEQLYDRIDTVRPCLPFMTVAVPCRKPDDPTHAGVIHVDGTARPQLLTKKGNPGMHAILQGFYERTGIPSLVNTSFNRHGEPIVNSPDDALDTWAGAELDALILGPFLVTR